MTVWAELKARLHPHDQSHPECWQGCYETKYAIAKLLQPASILEFGVRTGYSAFAFLTACPKATYLGIDNNSDTHGGFSGAINHARSLLAPFQCQFIESSSSGFVRTFLGLARGGQHLASPQTRQYDLVHVDGDHSFEGCFADLQAATMFQPRAILVDDFCSITDVQAACNKFATKQRSKYIQIILNDQHHGVTLFVPR